MPNRFRRSQIQLGLASIMHIFQATQPTASSSLQIMKSMASSVTCIAGSVGLGRSKLSSTTPLDRLGGLRLKGDYVSMRRRGLGTIKAMGAKYKGTQMKEQRLTEMIEEKVVQAREVCEGDATSVECRVAWDEVEEGSKVKADLRERMEKEDPLEYFCAENP